MTTKNPYRFMINLAHTSIFITNHDPGTPDVQQHLKSTAAIKTVADPKLIQSLKQESFARVQSYLHSI